MEKTKFISEYELNASTKMLFPYLSTASGLQEWFADHVEVDSDKGFYFTWDGVKHKARKVAQKTNQYIKFEFGDTRTPESKDCAYIEFFIDTNDLTQTSFLKVVDYSEVEDVKDLEELWNNLIQNLRERVGA
ncbi:MAG: START-like domain-containing protein [Cytophagaceae bacterium]